MKSKYIISTNKLLYEMFNISFNDSNVKTTKEKVGNKFADVYYIDFIYESSNKSSFNARLYSTDKDNIRFTIFEKVLLFMLIGNSRQLSDNNYFISMRKLRSIRGLKDNSKNTYMCYKKGLDRLSNKYIRLIPKKNIGGYKPKMVNCKLLSITNEVYSNDRLSEFNYSFNDFDSSFVKNSQKITTYFNPYSFIFKQYFLIQISLHLLRLISLNKSSSTEKRAFSYKLMLNQIHKVDQKGYIENATYYEYISNAENKQSSLLSKSYVELESILKQFVRSNVIKSFSISKRRSYKYLKDDEVRIEIKFIK